MSRRRAEAGRQCCALPSQSNFIPLNVASAARPIRASMAQSCFSHPACPCKALAPQPHNSSRAGVDPRVGRHAAPQLRAPWQPLQVGAIDGGGCRAMHARLAPSPVLGSRLPHAPGRWRCRPRRPCTSSRTSSGGSSRGSPHPYPHPIPTPNPNPHPHPQPGKGGRGTKQGTCALGLAAIIPQSTDLSPILIRAVLSWQRLF